MSEQTEPQQTAPSYTLDRNTDGSVVVKLRAPVRFQNDDVQRLTIPALTGRHMRICPWTYGDLPNVGQLVTFAALVIQPVGIVDELPGIIARDLGMEVFLHLGKALGIGAAR